MGQLGVGGEHRRYKSPVQPLSCFLFPSLWRMSVSWVAVFFVDCCLGTLIAEVILWFCTLFHKLICFFNKKLEK